jgi:hypothetical protein
LLGSYQKQSLNESNYIYTIQWSVSNINRKADLVLSASGDEWEVMKDINLVNTSQKTLLLYNRTLYNQVCLNFDKPVLIREGEEYTGDSDECDPGDDSCYGGLCFKMVEIK